MTIETENLPGTNAPSAAQQIRENLQEKHQTLKPRADELMAQLRAVPDPLPEERIDEISDLFSSVRTHVRLVDNVRVTEKEPYLRAERTIDAFFQGIAEPLKEQQKRAAARHGAAVTIRADRVRAEEEERTRQDAERAAEAKRQADERLEQERAEAAGAQAAAERAAEASRLEAERLRELSETTKETEPNPAASGEGSAGEPSDVDRIGPAAVSNPPTPPPAQLPTLQDRLAQEERDRLAELDRKRAQALSDRKASDLADATRAAARADNQAASAEVRHTRVVNAPAAQFARSRSNYGSLTTQQEHWDFLITDRNLLDKRVIWKFISNEALNAAVQSAVDSGVRAIKGVRIFKRRETQVR